MQKYGFYSTDEKDAASYILPDPLLKEDGTRIVSAAEWMQSQRSWILEQLKKYEYGEILPRPDKMEFQLLARRDDALHDTAVRKEVRIVCGMNNGKSHSFDILLYIPKRQEKPGQEKPVPAFAGLNFQGNHNTTDEEDVLPTGWIRPGVLFHPERASQVYRWVPETVIQRGYASVTACYHDLHPDQINSTGNSIFRLFFEPEEYPHIQEKYSVIGAWTWGLCRILDYLESDPDIDSTRVAVHGQSRLGKTSLWAGAVDPRFKMVISNCSGCGGGALHKRKIGENLSQHFQNHINHGTPSWFVKRCEDFIWHEEEMPIDQHELLAMIAPRPLAIGTASENLTADPKGEFLACRAASEVYQLFGSPGLQTEGFPDPDVCITGDISFHCRTGKHDQTIFDWQHYLQAADRYL